MDYLESIRCLGAVARPMNVSMMSFVDREWVWPGNDLKCKASWLQRHEWPPVRAKCSSIAGETCATKVGHGGKMQKMQQDVMSRCRLVYMLSRTSSICLQGI